METFAAAQSSFFYWLIQVSWQASVLAGLVIAAQTLLGQRLAVGWRYGLWFLVLARLALPSSLESRWSIFNLTQLQPAPPQPSRAAPRTPVAMAIENRALPSLSLASDEAGPALGTTKNGMPSSDARAAAQRSATSVGPVMTARTTKVVDELGVHRAAGPQKSWPQALASVLPWLWLGGVLFLVARVIWQNARFAAQLRKTAVVRSPRVIEALRKCGQQMRVRRLPLLLEAEQVKSPALYGLFRPRLLLPAGMIQEFSLRELRCVFLHELAHVKRRDMAVNWLITVFQALHWFNPVLWFAFSRMRADRELACDALALSRAEEGESQSYGETIIKILSGLNRPTVQPGLVGILEDKRQMKHRIRMIARFQRNSSWSAWALCVFVALGVITLTDAQSEKQSAPPRSDPLPASAAPNQETAPSPEISSGTDSQLSILTEDARLLIEIGELDKAEAKLQQAVRRDPENKKAFYYLSLIKEARYAQETRKRDPQVVPIPNAPTPPERAPSSVSFIKTNMVETSPGRELILQKMAQIEFEEVFYHNLPLVEVVRDLNSQAGRRDPQKRGINFIINPHAVGGVNLNDIPINLRLGHVRLGDVIDAVVKVAEVPIKYSVEDYAVVFTQRGAEVPSLFTRTFKVDPNTFQHELDHVLETQGQTNTNLALGVKIRSFFAAAGIDFPPLRLDPQAAIPVSAESPLKQSGKAIFYSDRTGLLLVRATMEELDSVERAVQMLNTTPPQVKIEAKLIEISQADQRSLGFDWFLGNTLTNAEPDRDVSPEAPPAQRTDPGSDATTNTVHFSPAGDRIETLDPRPAVATLTGILTDPQFRVVQRALAQRARTKTVSSPIVTTLSSRRAHMEVPSAGFTLDLLPVVLADGVSVSLEVDFTLTPTGLAGPGNLEPGVASTPADSSPMRVSTKAIIWDAQTMVLGPFPGGRAAPGGEEHQDTPPRTSVFLFVTPTIIDPAGNPVHATRPANP